MNKLRQIKNKIVNLLIRLGLYKPHRFYSLTYRGVPILEDENYPKDKIELRQDSWTILEHRRKDGQLDRRYSENKWRSYQS